MDTGTLRKLPRQCIRPSLEIVRAPLWIVTVKLNDLEPQAWLANVLDRIADLPQTRLHELFPWNWKAKRHQALAA